MVITDFCSKVGVRQKNNIKNNVVYGIDKLSIPDQLLFAPEEKFEKGFMLWEELPAEV